MEWMNRDTKTKTHTSNTFFVRAVYTIQMATLGGGIKGIAPRPVINGTMHGSSEYETVRFTLRNAWNGKAATKNYNGRAPAATPFRIVNNAGDYLSRQYYTSGGSNQVTSARSSITAGWHGSAGAVKSMADATGIPSATCNPRYVYDGSDYARYKRNRAVNKNYNDMGFGGANNGSQSALRFVRRH